MDNNLKVPVETLINSIKKELEELNYKSSGYFDNSKTIAYWNVGKHIINYLEVNEITNNYGKKVFEEISNSLEINTRNLYWSYDFYKTYSQRKVSELTLNWTYYRILLRIKDKSKRLEVEERIKRERLSKRELEILLRKEKLIPEKYSNSIILEHAGKPFVYKLKLLESRNELYVDCGFHFYKLFTGEKSYKNTDIIAVEKNNNIYDYKKIKKYNSNFYNFNASVIKVIDGDTIWVEIDLGFELKTVQKIRLRGINTGDIQTEDGKNAKKHLENIFNINSNIFLKTYSRDKYTRYLGDIYYSKNKGLKVYPFNGIFLNQELIDKGLSYKYYR